MRKVENHIKLSQEERAKLVAVIHGGKASEILHANILLMCDENAKMFTPKQIAEALNTTKQTINKVKQRYFEVGIDKCLIRKNAGRAPIPPKITGDVEAKIIALACSQAPKGSARWTLRLLADKSVELKIIDSISYESVGTLLKKHNLSLI